jgi:hypothetical protein
VSPPWPADRTAILIVTDSLNAVQPGSPIVISATSAVTFLELPKSSSELTLYAATFNATVAATFASCGITLDGTEPAPGIAARYASEPFDAQSVSTIEMRPVTSLPVTVRYQSQCTAPSPCEMTTADLWPLSGYPLSDVLAVSDDLALADTHYAFPTLDVLLRLGWAAQTVATATFTLSGAVALLPFYEHAIAAASSGDAFEIDPELRLVTRRSFGFSISAFSVGPEGSMLVEQALGCGATARLLQGTWNSTAVRTIVCAVHQVDQIAADRSDWSAYAADLKVHVLSGTTAVQELNYPLGDVISTLAITPSMIVAGPRQLDWSLLTRSTLTWTPIGRPDFTAFPRTSVLTPRGSILAGGDGGALAIRSNGSWCTVPLSTHLSVHKLSLAPSGRIAFAAMFGDTDGALLRISLPPDL